MADTRLRWTTADLEALPERLDGTRYELIDGELYVSRQPHTDHQIVVDNVMFALNTWGRRTGAGRPIAAPGVVLADDDNVVPDVAWVGRKRLALILDERGHLRSAPDLAVEVLSPGPANESRDRDAKLKLYSRRGVREYWIVDWHQRRVEVHRRVSTQLELVETLLEGDLLRSPLLAGFELPVAEVFADLSSADA